MIKFCLANHFDANYRYQIDQLKQLAADQSAIVIVPEQATLQAEYELLDLLQTENELLELLDCKGLLQIEVLSFKRIVQRILSDTSYADKRPLSDLGKQMLLADIIESGREQLDLYGEAHKIRGFLDQLSAVISDFRHQGIVADDLTKLLRQPDDAPLFDKKLTEIGYIYAQYLARLDATTFDDDGLIKRATELLAERPLFADKTVIVSGFSSMTGSEQQLLIALARQAAKTTVHIVVDDGQVVDCYARTFLDGLIAKMGDLQYVISENFRPPSAAVRAFRSVIDASTAPPGGIACFVANNSRAELEAVFSDIVRHYQTGDYRWRDMAIVTNQLVNYHRSIKRLAEIYKIPIFIDARRPAISHYIVDFILSLLRAILYNYRLRDVVKLLKTGFFELTERQIWQIENIALAYHINGKDWFDNLPADDDLRAAIAALMASLKTLQNSLQAAASGEQKIAALRSYLDDLAVLTRVADDVDQLYAAAEYERSEELAQVYNIIDDVFYQIYAATTQRNLSLEQFYDLLKLGFEKYEIGIIPQVQDYLIVGNIKRTRLAKLKAIYFIGMDETAIPSAVSRSTIFNDDEMMRLQAIGLERLATQAYNYNEEVYKSYENILKADVVKWYYGKATPEGDVVRPSIWFEQIGGVQATNLTPAYLAALNLDEAYLERLLFDLADANAAVDGAALAEHFSATAAAKAAAFSAGRRYQNSAPQLNEALISQLYGSQFSASVSRLESYAACPYQHFVKYGLKPKVEKEVDLDFLDIGDFYHKIIENVVNSWLVLPPDQRTTGQFDDIYLRHYEAYLEQHYRFRYNDKNCYFALRLRGVLKTALQQVVRQLAIDSFTEISSEVSFANRPDALMPALNLYDRADAVVNLRGVVDRLDVAIVGAENYLRIVDYKSSAKKLDVQEVLHGLQLQLMIYLNAACQFMTRQSGSSVRPFGAFYFSVGEVTIDDDDGRVTDIADNLLAAHQLNGVFVADDAVIAQLDSSFADDGASKIIDAKRAAQGVKPNRQSVTAEQLDTLKDYALYKAKQLARQIYSGVIAIKPVLSSAKTPCDYCQYGDICRFDATKSHENYARLDGVARDEALSTMKEKMSDELNQSATTGD